MNGGAAVLLVTAAGLGGVAAATVVHRRDALGAIGAVMMLLGAVSLALVGFATAAGRPSDSAQLQAFAMVVELVAVAAALAGVGAALVLRRRSGSDLLSPSAAPVPEAAEQRQGGTAAAADAAAPEAGQGPEAERPAAGAGGG